MPISYKRSVRVGELIQHTVSKLVKNIKELNTKFITITEVKLTDDLLNCKIYYSVFGSQKDKNKANNILNKNTKKIRCELASILNLRLTPKILFIHDNTNENATRIFNILDQIKKQEN
ncbi:MAG: 30S ribosome-binding factor RbfA [Endomicrobium sp.]|jgi:ribosome-binding factor A|nr:30S ribosome-binding factor RbfA [Endomicrobium sp.]